MYKLATNIMIETESRGPHATGHAYFDSRGGINTKKSPIKASEYVGGNCWRWMRKRMPNRLLGHCRYTTHGTQDENQNNHPHVGNRYAVIHNGVLKGYEYRPWKELCTTDCDSEAILRVMELGDDTEKAVARVFNCFYDSNFSVLALDKKTKEMHFFRNPARPLRVWRSKDFVLVGSTEQILESAFQKTFDVPSAKVEGMEKWTPVSGTFYTVKSDLKIERTNLFDFEPELPVQPALPTKVQQYSYYTSKTDRKTRVDANGNIVYGFDY